MLQRRNLGWLLLLLLLTTGAVIQSGATSDQLTVDATSKAARISLYDSAAYLQASSAPRTYVNFYATSIASGSTTTETIITLSRQSGTAAASSATTFVLTTGKRFRLTSFEVGSRGHATGTVQISTFNLRVNTGGACTASSTPIILAKTTATPATGSAYDRAVVAGSPPDGIIEIAGDGTLQLCISAAATFSTNAPTWFVHMTGYEY